MENMGVTDVLQFYRGKKVFVTGHTGFKGAWLCQILHMLGAEVTGYALAPTAEQKLSDLLCLPEKIHSIQGDIRDLSDLDSAMWRAQPEVVFHLAAQPIVREGYRDPVGTYSANVMGTVHVLECIRHTESVRSVINVTTDKVYQNKEWVWGYREEERLDGYDPYSNSKSCSELVTATYIRSFFADGGPTVSTVRAGNVIGGGDFAKDRIIPDCVRAVQKHQTIMLRNPDSIRPYQHVLDALCAYLLIAKKQYENRTLASSYNVGPAEEDCVTTASLAQLFCDGWGQDAQWKTESDRAVHEANFLRLDSSKIRNTLQWKPRWNIRIGMKKTVEWYRQFCRTGNVQALTEQQISEYFQERDFEGTR